MDILRIHCIAGRKSATIERRNHRKSIRFATRIDESMIQGLNQLVWVVVTIPEAQRGEWQLVERGSRRRGEDSPAGKSGVR